MLGIQVTKYTQYPHDFTETDIKIWDTVKPFTMTTPERVSVLIDAVKYIVKNNDLNRALLAPEVIIKLSGVTSKEVFESIFLDINFLISYFPFISVYL